MAYISAAAHSSRKKKIDRMREQAVQSILTCQSTINYMSAYNNDNSLKQSSLNCVMLCYKVFNDDYAHIVNMEDIAERTEKETISMRIITVVALFFLPGTFVSVWLSSYGSLQLDGFN